MRKLKKSIKHEWIFNTLKISNSLEGEIDNICSIKSVTNKSLSFSKKKIVEKIDNFNLIFAPENSFKSSNIIVCSNPRLTFIKILNIILKKYELLDIQKTKISQNSIIGSNVYFGRGVIIKKNVTIGDNVIIGDFVQIGENVKIKSNTTIGLDGFGFERDLNDIPIRFPHLGNVIIDSFAEIGSNVTINRGTLDPTVISKNVKIDDHCHVAHNVKIGENTIITAGSVIGGSVEIKKNSWLGLNCTINNGVVINENVIIGTGANVFQDVFENSKMAGFPSKRIPY